LVEHLSFEDAKKLLRNCHEWLKPQGSLMVHIQNMPFLASQLANDGGYDDDFHFEVLKWVYGTSGEGETNHPYGFHRWGYSKTSFSRILKAVGFKVVDATVDCDGFGLLIIAVK
jgi:predicted SAM-dependent methyltransferase